MLSVMEEKFMFIVFLGPWRFAFSVKKDLAGWSSWLFLGSSTSQTQEKPTNRV